MLSEVVSGTTLNPFCSVFMALKIFFFFFHILFYSVQKGNKQKVKALESKQTQFPLLRIHSRSRLGGKKLISFSCSSAI